MHNGNKSGVVWFMSSLSTELCGRDREVHLGRTVIPFDATGLCGSGFGFIGQAFCKGGSKGSFSPALFIHQPAIIAWKETNKSRERRVVSSLKEEILRGDAFRESNIRRHSLLSAARIPISSFILCCFCMFDLIQ
ncbi:hypothetical protein CDAR_442291 [Caerostris darwini]|uniref:Uncharacterized protein n=1 Tax=Caerostris darwini TaxID=1538125 RepID=A0AAV4UZZ6_9ARAC|nr:hypothetical protein CDAR_442291 [Caerostris darwini]